MSTPSRSERNRAPTKAGAGCGSAASTPQERGRPDCRREPGPRRVNRPTASGCPPSRSPAPAGRQARRRSARHGRRDRRSSRAAAARRHAAFVDRWVARADDLSERRLLATPPRSYPDVWPGNAAAPVAGGRGSCRTTRAALGLLLGQHRQLQRDGRNLAERVRDTERQRVRPRLARRAAENAGYAVQPDPHRESAGCHLPLER